MTELAQTIHARELALVTKRGAVYAPASLDADAGTVVALFGPARSGRTALLLTLAGRMRPTSGTARVCGHDIVREAGAVRRLVSLGTIAGVNDLENALTVRQHLTERSLYTPGHHRLDAAALLLRVGLADDAETRAEDLDTEQCMRLGIALALIGDPKVIAIDDLDGDLEIEQQTAIAALLREIAADGPTVLFTCVDERSAALADVTVTLARRPRRRSRTASGVREVAPHAVA